MHNTTQKGNDRAKIRTQVCCMKSLQGTGCPLPSLFSTSHSFWISFFPKLLPPPPFLVRINNSRLVTAIIPVYLPNSSRVQELFLRCLSLTHREALKAERDPSRWFLDLMVCNFCLHRPLPPIPHKSPLASCC